MTDDALVLLLVIAGFALWAAIAFRRWLYRTPRFSVPEDDGSRPAGADAELLEEYGYRATHGQRKIGVAVRVDGKSLESHLTVDGFAEKGGDTYVVVSARPGTPVDIAAGASVREHLLPYALLYDDTAGVLYIDGSGRKVHHIRFELEL